MEDGPRETEPAQAAPRLAAASEPVQQRTEVVGEPEPKAEKVSGEEDESAIREWFELIGRAGFWALVLYLFVFQVSVVEGPSMQPNFQTYDRLVIDKLTYRFSQIQRFDVIVFQAADTNHWAANGETKDYIKRVIGLPGEHVKLRGNHIYINGAVLKETFDFEPSAGYVSERDEFVVPPKHYFVLGDNRGDSKDSHNGLGYAPESQIRGIARLRFMPLNRWKWFWRE